MKFRIPLLRARFPVLGAVLTGLLLLGAGAYIVTPSKVDYTPASEHRAASSTEDADQKATEDREGAEGHASGTLGYLTPEHTLGNRQSPINILTTTARETDHVAKLHYRPSKDHKIKLGHTIKVEWNSGSTMEFDGKAYELLQFHFHTPAEHLLDGITYPMEIHLVHQAVDDPEKLLVVGVLFKIGTGHPVIDHILPFVPSENGSKVYDPGEWSVNDFFDEDDGYYYYAGSLTTPPYSEVVKWVVLDSVQEASPEQIEKIAEFEGNNARHIQDPHARTVEHCKFASR